MNKEEYLNEISYQKNNKIVKIIGNILLIFGLILLIGGIIFVITGFLKFSNQITGGVNGNYYNSSNIMFGFNSFTIGGFALTIGLFITGLGVIIRVFIANRREIAAYTIQQTMPLAKEGIEKITPTIATALGSIAKEIKKGTNKK